MTIAPAVEVGALPTRVIVQTVPLTGGKIVEVIAPANSATTAAAVNAALAAVQGLMDGADLARFATFDDFLKRWLDTLPTAQPSRGTPGWWSNAGQPTFFPG